MEEKSWPHGPLEQLSKDSNINILEAALPFVPPAMKQPLALYIKMNELTKVVTGFQDEQTLAACGLDDQNPNYELMLEAMKMAANKEQAQRIDQLMRIMNMSKLLPGLIASQAQTGGTSSASSSQADMMRTFSELLKNNHKEEETPMTPNWMNDPRVKKIAPEKLALLKEFIDKHNGRSPEDLIPEIISLNSKMQASGLTFEKEEMSLILGILQEGMSPEEKSRIDMLMQMLG